VAASVASESLSTTIRQSSAGTQASNARNPALSPPWWNHAWPATAPVNQP